MGKLAMFTVFILALMTGAILGALTYNYHYHISEAVLKRYNLVFMFFPAIAMFLTGFLIGRSGSTKGYEYKPLFHGKPRQLGQDGERLVMSALHRVGFVREKGGGK